MHPKLTFSSSLERLKLCWLYWLPCSCADMISKAQELLDIDLKYELQIYPGSLLNTRSSSLLLQGQQWGFKLQELCSVITSYFVGYPEILPSQFCEGKLGDFRTNLILSSICFETACE